MSDKKSYRYIHVEMILRFFAYYDWHTKYNGKLSEFLNEYMACYRHINEEQLQEKRKLFHKTIQFINEVLLDVNHTKLGHSLLEALMFGIAKNITTLPTVKVQQARSYYMKLQIGVTQFAFSPLLPDISGHDHCKCLSLHVLPVSFS